ncbi:MAG: thioredoxin family protein [Rhodospirillaceae bacterium]|nr:MAG: thioredoxin family protein [Rhodospirillaceae bacterium]
MAVTPPICDFGLKAPDFSLPGVDGQTHTLDSCKGDKGTLVVFICNHCPYVLAITERLVQDLADLQSQGIGVVAINSNDPDQYPEDSFDNMVKFAKEHNFTFPYLFDESQEVAKAYDAICTPDFFGFNKDQALQYRGRLDASNRETAPPDAERELLNAMSQISKTGHGPKAQISSMGCSIKWKQSS